MRKWIPTDIDTGSAVSIATENATVNCSGSQLISGGVRTMTQIMGLNVPLHPRDLVLSSRVPLGNRAGAYVHRSQNERSLFQTALLGKHRTQSFWALLNFLNSKPITRQKTLYHPVSPTQETSKLTRNGSAHTLGRPRHACRGQTHRGHSRQR